MNMEMLKPDKDLTIKHGHEKNEKRLEKGGAKWVDDGVEGGERLSITPDQLEGIKKYGYTEEAEVNGHQMSVVAQPSRNPNAWQYVINIGRFGSRIELNDDPGLARDVFKYAKELAKVERDETALDEKVEDFALERMGVE